MTKDEIQFILTDNNYLQKGTKESAIKVMDYLKNIESIQSKSSIEFNEFIQCISTLIAFSFRAKDTIPERWYCENDCRYTSSLICPGEFNLEENSKKICPYYKQENI